MNTHRVLRVPTRPGYCWALTHVYNGIETIGRARYASEIEAVTEAAGLMHSDRASVQHHRLDSLAQTGPLPA
jgi:hypothetical protein